MSVSSIAFAETTTAGASPLPRATSPVIEFLAVGGATLLILPLCWLLRWGVGLDRAELVVGFLMFHGAYVINDPHFAVSYLLFYRDVRARCFSAEYSRAQRARYVAAGFVVPAGLLLWASTALALRSAAALGLMIQAMFLLVGWHYVKQGFGVLAVLSARRAATYQRNERWALLLHCFAGWAYAWASPYDPGRSVEEKGVVYTTLGQPAWLEHVTLLLFVGSFAWVIWLLVQKWRREQRVPPLAPLCGLLITIWLWTVFTSLDPLFMYVIPALHSVQYLYFVWLLKSRQAGHLSAAPHFGRSVASVLATLAVTALALGFVLFHATPELLDGALSPRRTLSDLGATPYFAALFAMVNLHHYFMDFVIWRRENPETRFLRA